MSEWVDFDQWKDCTRPKRPGYVFEVTNGEGQSLLTACTTPLQLPFDWKSAPLRYRPVAEPKPHHSMPIPKPQQRP
ncbi:hypothetical protein [Microvirga roseola]|uniref:hypothetical protein n=1 Tax=Microvirga roseola TaxID=2883126 RepID=UPI001E58A6C9|nr:hypothetical protein [Microvirga roseola]